MRLAVTLLMFVWPCFAATYPQSHAFCEASEFTLAPADVPLPVQEFGLEIGNKGTHSHLAIVNQTRKPITRILILAEVLGDNGQYLLTLPFYGSINPPN